MINQKYAGRKYRYVYSTVAKPGWFLFEGFVKHDLETGEGIEIKLPEGVYASRSAVRAADRRGGRGRRLYHQLHDRREPRHVGMHHHRLQELRRRSGVPHRAAAQDLERHPRALGRSHDAGGGQGAHEIERLQAA